MAGIHDHAMELSTMFLGCGNQSEKDEPRSLLALLGRPWHETMIDLIVIRLDTPPPPILSAS